MTRAATDRPVPRAGAGGPPAVALLAALRALERAVRVEGGRTAGGGGDAHPDAATRAEATVLRGVRDAGPLTLGHLAARLNRDPSSVSVTASRLVERGLLVRREDALDRRRRPLSITAAGRRTAARAPEGELAALERALAACPRHDGTRLAASLAALAGALGAGPGVAGDAAGQ